jgi:ABC-type nitrate/sulfonate/bicarbonate transport system substrate-binding protein
MRTIFRRIAAAAASIVLSACATPTPPEPATLRLSVFPGAVNIPLIMGVEQGIFAKQGLTLEIKNTPDSDSLRHGLAAGTFDIVHATADNAIAMVEAEGKNAVIIMGGDYGLVEFMVRSDIASFSDIRGKVLAVDAPNTAYALVAKKILKNNGLVEGRDYKVQLAGGTMQRAQAMIGDPRLAAGMLNAPFSINVKRQGLKSMGQARSFIGPYQATSGFAMRDWAKAHPELVERYITAYVESVRWVMDPAHKDVVTAALARNFNLEPAVSQETYAMLMTPGFGLAPDAKVDVQGLQTVLALRAEIEGQWGGTPPAAEKYVDSAYYERAVRGVR